MVALGIGAIVLIVFGAVLRSALALVGAYALTTLVALPGIVDALAWIAAGGYTLLNVLGAVLGLAAILNAGKANSAVRRGRRY